ncbi:GGDEF-domain containing protein [Actinoplanes sp. ATCC 53533]|uniref:putative bifunctional diguanylate cyclase/phosphodiesterase n=1 Tax=Actinoplanes sp. ATCC 53533 TaxID=1288362 RepID=UPI000F791D9B|nr:EAL domain-containing protein [Actinoplanes sp. ATCC 53533]RSM55666.1 GGDEF-domain containing protein [Actinoplanes sp. ATCC 53533]
MNRVDRAVAAWTAVGLPVCVAYPFMGDGTPAAAFMYDTFVLLTLLVVLAGIRRNRPPNRLGWYVFAAAVAFRLAGDVTYEIYRQVLHQPPFPSLADVFYLGEYPLLAAGTLLLARGRRGRDVAGLLDAAIIATGLGLLWWILTIGPIAGDGTVPLVERLLGAAYPACDVLLLALLARMLTRTGRLTVSMVVMIAGTGALLAADVGYQLVIASHPDLEGVVAVGWLLCNVAWGASALHPSAANPAPARTPEARLGPGRLILLAASTLLAPVLLFIQGSLGFPHLSWLPIGVGAVVLFVLVLLRMSGFVTQVQRQSQQLQDLAMRDDLTGLPNRRLFEERLAAAVAAGPTQVAMLDLNGFKNVNDRFGHAVGDRLLAIVGRRIAERLREDDVAARMGGDEFAVLVPGTSPADMAAIVDRLTASLRRPIEVAGHELLVGASVGIGDSEGTDDPYEVLRRADIAMYAAKAQGGDQARRYAADLDERAGEEARLGAEMRTALDTGQFRLVYQPIVALPDAHLVAVEALIRWHHPERGLINPTDFIPVAEQNGFIVELGAWILHTACTQAVTWQHTHGTHAPGRIGVNVSARQLAEPGFTDLVAHTLTTTGLPAHHLVIEVTETAVFGGGQSVQTVKDLRHLGVCIALDDFGTGHSSLGLLQTVPVDTIKVDKTFVDTITKAGRHAVIATALIQVADGLGLTAVAEGVETAEQATELHRLGYRLAQGYHFGRPVAEPDFSAAVGMTAVA